MNVTTFGIVGAGNVAVKYLEGMRAFPHLRLVAIASRSRSSADRLAASVGDPLLAVNLDDLYVMDIDVVVNLTTPESHAEVSIRALQSGHHVFVEKPFALSASEAIAIHDAEEAAGRMVAAAPDTFLGSAGQTARASIDRGDIGEVVGGAGFVVANDVEAWHPDPTFLFQPGGGPVLDYGPYYIAAFINLLGGISEVSSMSRIGARRRLVTAPERKVHDIVVTTPTHHSVSVRFRSGVIATLLMSFDIHASTLPRMEIYGTEGTLHLPDPNLYDGAVRLQRRGGDHWETLRPVIPLIAAPGKAQLNRGLGVAHLVNAFNGGPLALDSARAVHILEVINGIETSGRTGQSARINSEITRPPTSAPRRDPDDEA